MGQIQTCTCSLYETIRQTTTKDCDASNDYVRVLLFSACVFAVGKQAITQKLLSMTICAAVKTRYNIANITRAAHELTSRLNMTLH